MARDSVGAWAPMTSRWGLAMLCFALAIGFAACSQPTPTPEPTPTPTPTIEPTPRSPGDKGALEALYEAATGADWERSDNWLSEVPVGQWYGVKTDPSGRVNGLELNGNGLRGAIPSELGGLSNLRWLLLHDNQLSGEIPSALGSLSSLESLWLQENRLSGEIPPGLGSLANLRELDLSDNQLRGLMPPELGRLAMLQLLWLHQNQLRGEIPPELGSLSNLAFLFLGGSNQLTGCVPSGLERLLNVPESDLDELGLPVC